MATATRMGQIDLLQFALANQLVFNKIKKTAGLDRVVLGASGGGKLSKDVCVFIRSMGIQLSEGYGLTETSPVINFNEPEFSGSFDPGNAGWFGNKMIDLTVHLMVTKQAQGLSPYTNLIRSLGLSLAYNTLPIKCRSSPAPSANRLSGRRKKSLKMAKFLSGALRYSKDTGICRKRQPRRSLRTGGSRPAYR